MDDNKYISKKPDFSIEGTPEKNSDEKPKIYNILKKHRKRTINRRNFLKFGMTMGTGIVGIGATVGSSDGDDDKGNTTKEKDIRSNCKSEFYFSHSGSVNAVKFSPDGSRIASAATDNKVRVWDAYSGELLLTYEGHSQPVNAISFSPDGTKIVSAGNDNTAKIWYTATGENLLTFYEHTDKINTVAFSPDGGRVASGGNDKTIRVWDSVTGDKLLTFSEHSNWIRIIVFSPDGQKIASGDDGRNASYLLIWETSSGAVTGIFKTSYSGPSYDALAYSPDGTKLVMTGDGRTHVFVLDLERSGYIVTYSGHFTSSIYAVAYSPDGSKIASAGADNEVHVWSAASGDNITIYKGHEDEIRSVDFSPDGTRIVSAGNDKLIHIWIPTTGKLDKVLLDQTDPTIEYGNCNTDGDGDSSTWCTCDTVCTCESVCTCDKVCTCDTQSSGGGGGTSSYWYPN